MGRIVGLEWRRVFAGGEPRCDGAAARAVWRPEWSGSAGGWARVAAGGGAGPPTCPWTPGLGPGGASAAASSLLESDVPSWVPPLWIHVTVFWLPGDREVVTEYPGGPALSDPVRVAAAAWAEAGVTGSSVTGSLSPPSWFDRSLWPECDVLEVMCS